MKLKYGLDICGIVFDTYRELCKYTGTVLDSNQIDYVDFSMFSKELNDINFYNSLTINPQVLELKVKPSFYYLDSHLNLDYINDLFFRNGLPINLIVTNEGGILHKESLISDISSYTLDIDRLDLFITSSQSTYEELKLCGDMNIYIYNNCINKNYKVKYKIDNLNKIIK